MKVKYKTSTRNRAGVAKLDSYWKDTYTGIGIDDIDVLLLKMYKNCTHIFGYIVNIGITAHKYIFKRVRKVNIERSLQVGNLK